MITFDINILCDATTFGVRCDSLIVTEPGDSSSKRAIDYARKSGWTVVRNRGGLHKTFCPKCAAKLKLANS